MELTKDDFKKDIGIKDYCLFVKSATFQEADKIRVEILKNQEIAKRVKIWCDVQGRKNNDEETLRRKQSEL